ncbi:MAG TPA: PDZ domain-containing protein [Candidatus Omnitrophota bacterium]|nr:PDZ domain-containing protein [Candidatus Omnitrophota bacterium]
MKSSPFVSKNLTKGLLFLFLTGALIGFSPFPSKPKACSFTLPGTLDEAWEATCETLQAEKIPVLISDKERGYIQTNTFPLYKKEYRTWCKAPMLSSSGFCVLEIGLVNTAPSVTAVGIKALFKRKSGFYFLGFRKRDSSRGRFEKMLAGRINDRLLKKKFPKLENLVVGCNFRFDESIGKYVIAEVTPSGFGYQQGLRNKDVLLKIDGREIDPGNLFDFFLDVTGEVQRTFTVKRKNEEIEIPVSVFYLDPQLPHVGLTVTHDEETGRFKVTAVEGNSPAARGGFREGDVLIKENALRLDGWLHYYRALISERTGIEQTFLVERNGESLTLTITPVAR